MWGYNYDCIFVDDLRDKCKRQLMDLYEQLTGKESTLETIFEDLDKFAAHNNPILVAEWDIENYAMQVAEEQGADLSEWPYTCIDWASAAQELSYDYTTVTFEGNDYLAQIY